MKETTMTDPFEPWEGVPEAELAQEDTTPSTLKEFLRAVIRATPPPSVPAPERGRRVLGHIKGYPG
jgi:hypothetical protein